MSDSHRYAMLLSALPDHGPLFGARQTPLSRIRLQQRLTLLDPEDAACLHALLALLDWARQTPERDDAAVSAALRAGVAALSHPFARELATWRLELRTLISALRRRRAGHPPPAMQWGFGRWVGQIRQHWSEPTFRLDGAFPWLPDANQLLEQGDALGLERLLFGVVWAYLERMSDGHWFDFEAVLLYALRWELIARWTAQDGTAGLTRFDSLAATILAEVELEDMLTQA